MRHLQSRASKLTEQIYSILSKGGSNQANEVEKLILRNLVELWSEASLESMNNLDKLRYLENANHR